MSREKNVFQLNFKLGIENKLKYFEVQRPIGSLVLIILASLCFSVSVNAEDTTFTTEHFSGSGNCSQCHNGMRDNKRDDVSIVKDWGASLMANSTKDPFWLAKFSSELKRNSHLSPVINDKCTQCHAPMANYEITEVQGLDIKVLGPDGILSPDNAFHDPAMNGVSCTVCHQIKDDPTLGTDQGFSGKYKINDTKTLYGQFNDVFATSMVNATGYTPAYSAHISESKTCATCHELSTPFVDGNGTILTTTPDTEFPEQTPYTEWENSSFAGVAPQSCQSCHMPKTTAKVASRPRWLGEKEGFAKHHLVGANTTILKLLKDNAAELDVISTDLDLSIQRARSFLQSSVTMELVSTHISNGILEAKLKLTNHSGHKTPTSYPSRRMWINFKVTDGVSQTLFESGKLNGNGSIVGADNDFDQSKVEPHYDVITKANQVQIYETIMGNSDGGVTYTLLRAAQYLKDNRLTPQGFDKSVVPSKVAVWGQADQDGNFNLGSDEIIYRVPVPESGSINLDIKLNYQAIMHGFIEDLYGDVELTEVAKFKSMYDPLDLKTETITQLQATIR